MITTWPFNMMLATKLSAKLRIQNCIYPVLPYYCPYHPE